MSKRFALIWFGVLMLIAVSLPAANSPATAIYHIISAGQSLSHGCSSDPRITSVQPFTNLMASNATTGQPWLNGVTGPLIPAVPYFACVTVGLDEFPLLDNSSQLTYMARDYRFVVSNAYQDGSPLSILCGPSCAGGPWGPFTLGVTHVATIAPLVAALGKTYVLWGINWTHGENDEVSSTANYSTPPTTAAAYEAGMVALQSDYQTAINATGNHSGTLPIFLNQNSDWAQNWGNGGVTNPGGPGSVPHAAIGQYRVCEDHPGLFYCTTPKYMIPNRTGSNVPHLGPLGSLWLGELEAKAWKSVFIDGQYWIPLIPRACSRSGAIITLQMWVPVGKLRWNTSALANSNVYLALTQQPDFGFEFFDSNASATIGSVAITASDTITITLSGTPTGATQRVRYAYTAPAMGGPVTTYAGGAIYSGIRAYSGLGNLIDTDPAPSRYGLDISDWAWTFDIPVTFSSTLSRSTNGSMGGGTPYGNSKGDGNGVAK